MISILCGTFDFLMIICTLKDPEYLVILSVFDVFQIIIQIIMVEILIILFFLFFFIVLFIGWNFAKTCFKALFFFPRKFLLVILNLRIFPLFLSRFFYILKLH